MTERAPRAAVEAIGDMDTPNSIHNAQAAFSALGEAAERACREFVAGVERCAAMAAQIGDVPTAPVGAREAIARAAPQLAALAKQINAIMTRAAG